MPEMYYVLRSRLNLHKVLVGHLQKTTKEHEILKKYQIHDIYQNKLDKACFQRDMDYGDCKDLTRRSTSDKKLRGKTFNLDKNLNYDGIQHKLVLKVYTVFDKKDFLQWY